MIMLPSKHSNLHCVKLQFWPCLISLNSSALRLMPVILELMLF
uniref:Uncharacterized protein n=1 Tax=Arundo donax TaxID=35708 RepID=A0A0A8Y4C8_ARUDO